MFRFAIIFLHSNSLFALFSASKEQFAEFISSLHGHVASLLRHMVGSLGTAKSAYFDNYLEFTVHNSDCRSVLFSPVKICLEPGFSFHNYYYLMFVFL